jgi:hypothetical protein
MQRGGGKSVGQNPAAVKPISCKFDSGSEMGTAVHITGTRATLLFSSVQPESLFKLWHFIK